MIDIQTISIVLEFSSVSIAALYYAFTLRYTRMNLKNTLKTRQAQLFMNVYIAGIRKIYKWRMEMHGIDDSLRS